MTSAIVAGGGVSGVACAQALAASGVDVRVRDRGRRLAGRMASRTLRDTGTAFDGRVVDIGASYFTVSDPRFGDVVSQLEAAGVTRPWTTAFHVAGPSGIEGIRTGPMRHAAPAGLRSVVEALAEGLSVSLDDPVGRITPEGTRVRVDDELVDVVAACMPTPQAQRIADAVPATPITWEPVIAVTCVFAARSWTELDGVFVNDDPIITWVADDGRRRGDEAPVLVAHASPVLAALHLDDPAGVIRPVVAAVQRVLGTQALPEWAEAHRWTFAKPISASEEPYWMHDEAPFGVAGDAWAGGPRVEAAWLSGHLLGGALIQRMEGDTSPER